MMTGVVRPLTQTCEDLDAFQIRQAKIKNDQVRPYLCRSGQCVVTVGRLMYACSRWLPG